MELSIKLDLTDEQYEEFKKSSEDAVSKLLTDPGFKDTIAKIVLQSIHDYLESPTGKDMIRKTLTGDSGYSYSRNDKLDTKFANFLIEKASNDFASEFNTPFRDTYIEMLKDEEFVKKVMLNILYNNMSKALAQSVSGDIETLYGHANMSTMRLDAISNALNKITGENNCF